MRLQFWSADAYDCNRTPTADHGEAGDSDTYLLFTIEDTGIGIKADAMDSLFEHFTQQDGSTTRRFGGVCNVAAWPLFCYGPQVFAAVLVSEYCSGGLRDGSAKRSLSGTDQRPAM
jgi:hypothetical protein